MNSQFDERANALARSDTRNFPKFESVFRVILQTTDLVAGAGNLFEFALNPLLPNRLFYFHTTIAGTNVIADFEHEFLFNDQLISSFRTIDRGTAQNGNLPRIIPAQNSVAAACLSDDAIAHNDLSSANTFIIPPQTLWIRADRYRCRVNRWISQGLSNRFLVQINSSNSPI